MNLYEFEGKNLFAKHGIAIPKGVVVSRGENVSIKYQELGIKDVVVKAQVLSGKRGKNNGIKFCSSADEVQHACAELFANSFNGQYVEAVLIEEKLDIAEEHYLSITYDTNQKQPVLIYSAEGGMDIEDVSEDKIIKISLDIRSGDINSDLPFADNLWQCFAQEDTRVVEINPLVKTKDGRWFAAGAKFALD